MKKNKTFLHVSILLVTSISANVALADATVSDAYTEELQAVVGLPSNDKVALSELEAPSLAQQLVELKAQLNQIQQQNYLQKIDDLRHEIHYLRGIIDVQMHDLKSLQTSREQINTAVHTEKLVDAPAVQSLQTDSAKDASNSEQKSYQRAFNSLKDRDYSQAESQFLNFLQAYPTSDYIPNAYYWLGEIYLLQGKYTLAENNLKHVLERDGHHNKTPDAMLKLAMVYVNAQKMDLAKQMAADLQHYYPDSAAARMAKIQLGTL